jgi:choline monooxygenase
MKHPPFERDLARASTLPSRWYVDPEIHALELERIFARTWQPVGDVSLVSEPGAYFTSHVGREPIVVARDLGGELRAHYNVCRHRAGAVAEGSGKRKSLQCQYHGWTYGLDGKLLHTPEFDGVQCFDKANFGLVPIKAATFGPFVFVNLDPEAEPLENILGDIPRETARYRLEAMQKIERRDYVIQCNWKVYVDNYLEGYHVPIAHPGLYKELDYSNYRVETFRWYSKQYSPFRPAQPGTKRQYGDVGPDQQALYYWVYPNWMLNIYPDNMSINIIVPLGLDRTLTIFEWYYHDPVAARERGLLERTLAFSDEIQQEDIKLCEMVQARLGSRAYESGRFSVLRENGVHHFQGLVYDALTG